MSIACIVNFSNVYWNEKPKILMVFNGLSWFLFRFLSRRRTMLQIKVLCYKATHHLQLSLLFTTHTFVSLCTSDTMTFLWIVYFLASILIRLWFHFFFYNLEILSNFFIPRSSSRIQFVSRIKRVHIVIDKYSKLKITITILKKLTFILCDMK